MRVFGFSYLPGNRTFGSGSAEESHSIVMSAGSKNLNSKPPKKKMLSFELAANKGTQTTVRQLPPLILHPCNHHSGQSDFADSMLRDETTRQLCQSRYSELRMLCFVGKDINRWLSQCLEDSALMSAGISEASLIGLLLFDPPMQLVHKMQEWRVGNFQVIFSRALGVNAAYPDPPPPEQISESFLLDLNHYADALFDCRFRQRNQVELRSADYDFEIFTSAEYTRMLESGWEEA